MVLPFTIDQFMAVFAAYNDAIWPIQIVLNLLGIAAIVLALRSDRYSRIVAAILAVLWVWTGAVYHLTFFVTVNPAAVGFGSLFLVQAVVFFVYGAIMEKLRFTFERNLGYTGAALMLYGLIVILFLVICGSSVPRLTYLRGSCPTTIFTFGLPLTAGRYSTSSSSFTWSLIGLQPHSNWEFSRTSVCSWLALSEPV
jgi:hypothetical protein